MIRSASLLALVGGLVALPAQILAQAELTVPGRVVDAAGTPVPGQTVLLHRVTPEGGAMLAETVTGDDGRFVLRAPETAVAEAVYFAATRYRGELFIGPMLRPPLPADSGFVLRVGVDAVGAGPMSGPAVLPGSSTGSVRRWFLAFVPLLGLVGVIAWMLTRSGGPVERRRLLIRVARLDNVREDGPAPEDEPAMDAERRQLIDEIARAAQP
jgi:hypothetical protein